MKTKNIFASALAFLLCLSSTQAFAQYTDGNQQPGIGSGGFTGSGPALVTVEQIKDMPDESWGSLKGHIIRSLGGKHYEFKDDTGTITVEISGKRWQGQNIGPDDPVEIYGELDKEWDSMEIEVKQITKQ